MFMEKTYDNRVAEPTPDRVAIMQKLLLAFVVARPGSVLKLPGLKVWRYNFELAAYDSRLIHLLIEKHKKIVRCRSLATFENNGNNALKKLVNSQLRSLHPSLYSPNDDESKLLYLLGNTEDDQLAMELAKTLQSQEKTEDLDSEEDEDATDDDEDPSDPDYNPEVGDIDDEDTEQIAELCQEYESNVSHPDRAAWLKKIEEPEFDFMSSRVRAFLHVYEVYRLAFPAEKILVFSPFLKVLDIFATALKEKHGVKSLRYDGTLDTDEREAVRSKFSECSRDVPMMITASAGGVGLNITDASIIIQDGPWWNHN
jgi:SNF2 family DNA or RNA helicase